MTNCSLFRKICLIVFCILSILISCKDDSATLDLNDDHAFSSSEIVPINKESLLIFGSKNHLYSIQKNPLSIHWKADLKIANAKFLNNNNRIFLTITPEVGNTYIISIDENTGDILWKSSFNDRWDISEYYLYENDRNIIVEKETLAGKLERYLVNYTTGKLSKVESKIDLSTKSFSIKFNLENSIRLQNHTYLKKTTYDSFDTSTILIDQYKISKLTEKNKEWEHTFNDLLYVYGSIDENIYIGVESVDRVFLSKINDKTGVKQPITNISHVNKLSLVEDKVLIIEDGKSLRILDSKNDEIILEETVDGLVASTIHHGDLINLTKDGKISVKRLDAVKQ